MPDIINRLKNAYSTGQYAEIINLLPELFQAADEGQIVALPCRVGDIVWCVRSDIHSIEEWHVKQITFNDHGNWNILCGNGERLTLFSDIGKTAFLTKEEAKAALKKENKNGN